MSLINFKNNNDLSGYTLIIPSVSVGNVAQLTVDLLISSCDLKEAGTLWHPALVAAVSSDPYKFDPNGICTACEIYVNEELKLAALQIRSSLETKLMSKFFEDLTQTICNSKFKKVIILASGFDYELHNITGEKFYFVTNSNPEDITKKVAISLLQKQINDKYVVQGSGFAIKLYEILCEKLNCLLLVKYSSEGDNRPDAFQMLAKLFQICGIGKNLDKPRVPFSWNFVYGAPAPLGLF